MFHPGGQIELAGRDAYAQGFQDGVAADDQIVGIGSEPVSPATGSQTRIGCLPALGRLPGLVGLVVDTIFGLGGRPPPAQFIAVFAARTLGRAFLVSHVFSVKAGGNRSGMRRTRYLQGEDSLYLCRSGCVDRRAGHPRAATWSGSGNSIHSAGGCPFETGVMAMWAMDDRPEAPCQCLTPAGQKITSPGFSLRG